MSDRDRVGALARDALHHALNAHERSIGNPMASQKDTRDAIHVLRDFARDLLTVPCPVSHGCPDRDGKNIYPDNCPTCSGKGRISVKTAAVLEAAEWIAKEWALPDPKTDPVAVDVYNELRDYAARLREQQKGGG